MKKNTCFVSAQWHNAGTALYRFASDQEITVDRVADWLVAIEGFDAERDSADLHFEMEDEIDLDEPLPKCDDDDESACDESVDSDNHVLEKGE